LDQTEKFDLILVRRMTRFFKDRVMRFLFFPSVALWLMTVAVFASQDPIHLSSQQEAVITATANPVGYWSLKFGLLFLTIAFSVGAVLRDSGPLLVRTSKQSLQQRTKLQRGGLDG